MWTILSFSVTAPGDLFPTVTSFFFSRRSAFHCVGEAGCVKRRPAY